MAVCAWLVGIGALWADGPSALAPPSVPSVPVALPRLLVLAPAVAAPRAGARWRSPWASATAFADDAVVNRTLTMLPSSFVAGSPGQSVSRTTDIGRNLPATQTQASAPATSGTTATQGDPRNALWLTTYQHGACCDRLTGFFTTTP